MREKIALDSQRSTDESGHLRVARTVLSKAGVNPYFGREIPGYEELGLDPDKVYQLLRAPKSLEEGAETFKGKPLLIKHEYVDSSKHDKDLVIGTVGSNITYEDGKLYGDITVWDDEAIELIDNKKLEELSASYWYEPKMSRGVFENQPYDGIMNEIRGNHVALVSRGRIGRDAIISDHLPFELEFNMLKKGTKQRLASKLQAVVKGGIAQDGDVEEIIREVAENIEHKPSFDMAELERVVGDAEKFAKIAELLGARAGEDEYPEDPEGGAPNPAKDTEENEEEYDTSKDEDERAEDEDEREVKREAAMDADAIAAKVQAQIESKYRARDKVEPLVGRIALDGFKNASEIYKYALKHAGVACDGVNEAGLAQMVAMTTDRKNKPSVAHDSAIYEPSPLTNRFRKA